MSSIEFFVLLALGIVIVALQCLQLMRRPSQGGASADADEFTAVLEKTTERTERELRNRAAQQAAVASAAASSRR